jgi:pilus assembly protein CpaB
MARISSGTMTVVVFAILIGLGSAFVVRQKLKQPGLPPLRDLTPAEQTVLVPTAAMDLAPGQTLTINEIALLSLSPEKYKASAFVGVPFMRDANQISGRRVKSAIKKGEPFLPELFYPSNSGPGIAERLQPGYRAVTVPIENIGAVEGFALPGSVVDVMFRSRSEGDRPEVTLTLLERVEVLALDSNVVPGQSPTPTPERTVSGSVTLAVTPQQGKMLKVVEGRGELSLALRNGDDNLGVLPFNLGAVSQTRDLLDNNVELTAGGAMTNGTHGTVNDLLTSTAERVTLDDLLGLPANQPPKQMEIYMGAEKKVVEFARTPEEGARLLQRGGRIRTPIAHEPARGVTPIDRRQASHQQQRSMSGKVVATGR